jgi:hypothetical protein
LRLIDWLSAGKVRLEGIVQRFISGSQELEPTEGRTWLYDVASESGSEQQIEVRLTGTANATQNGTLPEQVASAKETSGQSVVERILGWESPPPMIEIGSEWVTLHHRNGYFSRIGRRLPSGPQRLEVLTERSKIRIPYGQGVEEVFEYSCGRWTLKSLHGGVLRREGPLMLSDVIARVSDGQAQDARDLDPEGTAMLPRRQLQVPEARVLRSLIEEYPYNSVEEIRAELRNAPSLSYEQVEDVLDALRIQGYVEEFRPGHWRASEHARHIRRRLLIPLAATA